VDDVQTNIKMASYEMVIIDRMKHEPNSSLFFNGRNVQSAARHAESSAKTIYMTCFTPTYETNKSIHPENRPPP